MSFSPHSSGRILRRRLAAARKLEKQIPRLNLTCIIIRVTQFLILVTFSLLYAMARPNVFLDIFVWPQNTKPPFQMTVFRNTTAEWQTRAAQLQYHWAEPDIYSVMSFSWNSTKPPEGLSEKYVCKTDPRWGCDGSQWAATRIGWLDSWPFEHVLPPWIAGTVHIDRYIFWLVLCGGFLGAGHSIVVLWHAIEPTGLGFYKYSAVMDFFISVVFLLLGIFPIAIQRHLAMMDPEIRKANPQIAPKDSIIDMYTSGLKVYQQYAFSMGWILWSLYTITFLLNVILIRNLQRYKQLRKTAPVAGDEEETPPTTAAATSGFERRMLQLGATGSYSRVTGRSLEIEV
ncbi:hypothetical protein FN846DRAFT_919028 [Sphaerosporella brunnea]|uniref:Uncharacterized protein n=1 Tax=Sphaerosporella brunnea TaxID=1250544 RepID=A0A5J5EXN9_9PEZI|nr:hypothetical protein FN846DRAFT_919028 [Sphaerosporella brunnea]